ncbi:MAG: hypothetical protein DRO62_02430 [Candidatus Altiarchaeales archaeon]|nr:MAG: hypothetical protein DRO62_02430 [Candidatus Altiarchaeales archaeon]
MKRYLLDTSVYGVLADKEEEDYEVVKKIIEYAKKNREHFVTTFIIAKELDSKKMSKRIKDTVLPEYYSSFSVKGVLQALYSNEYELVEKLAWNYIQKLEKKEASRVMDDALNYAWSSVAGIDVFVTRNRRGILAEEYHKVLERSNKKMRLKFVRIAGPKEFYGVLV